MKHIALHSLNFYAWRSRPRQQNKAQHYNLKEQLSWPTLTIVGGFHCNSTENSEALVAIPLATSGFWPAAQVEVQNTHTQTHTL